MDALFIIPAFCSKSVNEKIIPALAKLIERNVLLTNSSLFRKAAMVKYSPRFNKPFSKIKEDGEYPVIFLNQVAINESLLTEMEKEVLNSIILESPPQLKRDDSDDLVNHYKDQMKAAMERLSNAQDQNTQKKATAEIDALNNMLTQLNNDRRNKIEREKAEKSDKGDSELDIAKGTAEIEEKQWKNLKAQTDIQKTKSEMKRAKQREKYTRNARSGETEYQTKHTFQSKDQIEVPSGVQFFNSISLEPTIMEIPITFNLSRDPEDGNQTMVIRVGVKCIPYFVDDIQSIKRILKEARVMNAIERLFKIALRKLDLVKAWFKPWDEKSATKRAISKGNVINPDEAKNMILYSPNMNELDSPRKLANLFNMSKASPWSTMIILSSFDLEDEELKDTIKNYKKMTNYTVGDLVITNETKESAYFCTVKYGSCQEISFEYLKKILNLDNIIDASIVSRMTRPFSKVGGGKSIASVTESKQIKIDRINKIIQG